MRNIAHNILCERCNGFYTLNTYLNLHPTKIHECLTEHYESNHCLLCGNWGKASVLSVEDPRQLELNISSLQNTIIDRLKVEYFKKGCHSQYTENFPGITFDVFEGNEHLIEYSITIINDKITGIQATGKFKAVIEAERWIIDDSFLGLPVAGHLNGNCCLTMVIRY